MTDSFPIPPGAIVLASATYRDDDGGKLMPAVPVDPQPASIEADADGVFPFILIGGEERQFQPAPTLDPNEAARAGLRAKIAALDDVTGPRWLETIILGQAADPFIKQKITEKQALRQQLADLE